VALEPDWHETRLAARVLRHTEILRGVAHQLSNDPEREDRPANAREAKAGLEAYLQNLADTTARTGLAAPTAAFIDDLAQRTQRYIDHLFVCFDHPQIPASTNELERFFGEMKAGTRRTLGAKSTSNGLVANLGADLLIATQQLRKAEVLSGVREPNASIAAFAEARDRISQAEVPAIRQRSILRYFERHLQRLRTGWQGDVGTGA
jgi:hypothetical protein